MSTSKLDSIYRSLLLTKFFTRGWGKPDHMKKIFALRRQLADRDIANGFVRADHPVVVDKEVKKPNYVILDAHFRSPAKEHLGTDLLPEECQDCFIQILLPAKGPTDGVPVCVQFAGTGDHFFWRRRKLMAEPLLEKHGVASVLVENPFYGMRKPKQQLRSSLRYVSDIFVMGACLILESLVIHHWCKRQGFGPLIFHGVSMGGHMACLSSTVIPRAVGIVPCLAWSSASLTFTKGVLTNAIPWSLLEKQLQETMEELWQIGCHDLAAFKAGVRYAQSHIEGDELVEFLMPKLSPVEEVSSNVKDVKDMKSLLRRNAVNFMRGIMDECTHLHNFATPLDPSLCIAVAAEKDAYQPREGVCTIPDIWPGAQLRYITGHGHVTSYLMKHNVFRRAICESLHLLQSKYHD